MKRVLIGLFVFVVYLACVIAVAFALHFSGTRFALFCIILGLLGGALIVFAIWYTSRVGGEATQTGGSASINLDALLRDADRKVRTSRLGVKSLTSAQIIYVIGEDNSAKTQTVVQSGLDAELLAGNLYRDGVVAPTQLANIWLAGSSVIVEAGGSLLQRPALWQRLIRATQPGKLGSLFRKAAGQPPRAVVVCVSAERVPGSTEAGYNADQIRASAQMLNERLRQLSQMLGISVPVYVLFTKLDTLAHFADYVGRLSADEVKAPLGSLVAQVETGSGLYAERASAIVSTRLDELIYALSEFRIEVLSRSGDLKMLASAYEFPRDLQKRRGTIVDFLVDLTRPSQLGINPFLRGFFFSGMRAVLVDNVAAAPGRPQASTSLDAGATRVFSVGGAEVNQAQQQSARPGSRKVPQWAFLPHLFSKLLLSDESALEASRTSTNVNVLKRVLLACACSCIFIYLVLLTISFFNNRDWEQQVAAVAAVPIHAPAPPELASIQDLQTLNRLGALLVQLDSNRKEKPLMYRWGLYSVDKLYPIACKAYSNKFRPLLLGPAQANILKFLHDLPPPPSVSADYMATYRPLKAYLISTSYPGKSAEDPQFLAPALMSAWAGTAMPPAERVSLAQIQFETYATLLTEPESCMAVTGDQSEEAKTTVYHAQEYLKGLSAFEHVYQSMLAYAGKHALPVSFNARFSDRYIRDYYQVPGAFTKAGFTFMQDAMQHPDSYVRGEEWVLGRATGPPLETATLTSQLQKRYVGDYITQWRNYMDAANFVPFKDWNDAAGKLSALDSNSSAILELFYLVSVNTGVAQPEIVAAFQAPQAVVPSNSPDNRPAAASNQPYIQALQGLEQAIKNVSQNSLTANDPAAAMPVNQAAGLAELAAENLRGSFNLDPDGKMDAISFARLEDPIQSARALAAGQITKGPNTEGQAFCAVANNVLGKFPFNRNASVDAAPEDVAAFFSPVHGTLAEFAAKQSQLIVFQNGGWIANPASAVHVNPAFLHFLNSAQEVAAVLLPTGAGIQPTLSFTLKASKAVPDAVLTIDGNPVGAGQSVPFQWKSSPDSKIVFMAAQKTNTISTGSWSVFHLGLDAKRPGPNTILPIFLLNGRRTDTVPFEIEGPGARLLDPHFMDQLRCVSNVVKP